MIQRIQSIYLFLVFVFALLSLTFPLANVFAANEYFSINLISFKHLGPELFSGAGYFKYGLAAILAIIMILTFITIFRYKKRMLQIKFGRLNIALHVVFVALAALFLNKVSNTSGLDIKYGISIVFPLVSIVLIILANIAIRKDEKLVRAADRLR